MKFASFKLFLLVSLFCFLEVKLQDPGIFSELSKYVDDKLEKAEKANTVDKLINFTDSDAKNPKKAPIIKAARDFILCTKNHEKNCKDLLLPFHFGDEKLFNTFDLDKYSMKNSLVIAGLLAVEELNVKNMIHNIDEFIKYLHGIQSMYRSVPYQNRNHPAELLNKLIIWTRKIRESNEFTKGPVFQAFLEDLQYPTAKKERLQLILAITGHDSFYQGLEEKSVCDPTLNYNLDSQSNKNNELTSIICKAVKNCGGKLFAVNEKISAFVTHKALQRHNFYVAQISKDAYNPKLEAIFSQCGKDTSNEKGINIDKNNFIYSMIISTTDFIEDKAQDKFIEKIDDYNADTSTIYQIFMNALDNSFTVTKSPALAMRLAMQILCQDFSVEFYKKYVESGKEKVLVSNNDIFNFIFEKQTKVSMKMKLFYLKFDELTKNTLRVAKNLTQNYMKMMDTLNYELSRYNSNHFNYFKMCVVNNYLKEKTNSSKNLTNPFVEWVNGSSHKVKIMKKRLENLKSRKTELNAEENEEVNEILPAGAIDMEYENEEGSRKNFLKK